MVCKGSPGSDFGDVFDDVATTMPDKPVSIVSADTPESTEAPAEEGADDF